MKAMVLERAGRPLELRAMPVPSPRAGQVLVRVLACAVCRTDLHVVDGELKEPKLPLVPGHEIVGVAETVGEGCGLVKVGDRIGIPWLGWTCGVCEFCRAGHENLCSAAKFTGYTLDGGYAEYCVADERYCFKIPEGWTAEHAAPLLCAGLIGYRAYRMAAGARRIGFYGFGAAAHLLAQLAVAQGCEVYAFTRKGDIQAQAFARKLGCVWADNSDESPPHALDAALIFAPAGELVPTALAHVRPGGTVVCAAMFTCTPESVRTTRPCAGTSSVACRSAKRTGTLTPDAVTAESFGAAPVARPSLAGRKSTPTFSAEAFSFISTTHSWSAVCASK